MVDVLQGWQNYFGEMDDKRWWREMIRTLCDKWNFTTFIINDLKEHDKKLIRVILHVYF